MNGGWLNSSICLASPRKRLYSAVDATAQLIFWLCGGPNWISCKLCSSSKTILPSSLSLLFSTSFSSFSSAFLSSKSVFFSRPLSASSSTRPCSRSLRPSFAAAASYSCTFNKNEVSRAPSRFTPSLAFTTWSSVARFITLVADVFFSLAALHAVERRLRDVDVPALDQFLHVPEEKSQQQRADVTAIHVRVGHENNFVVAQFSGVEIV